MSRESRNTGLDLMRLVCMIMVVSLHYFGEGGINSCDSVPFINRVIATSMVVICRGAVNCFYMNSGYFITEDINVAHSWQRTFKLYGQIWFYSVIVFIVSLVFGISEWSTVSAIRALLPIMGNQWWFITVFLLLSFLRPLIGKTITKLSNKELAFVIAVFLYFDAIQSVFGVNVFNEMGNGLLHGVTMLLLGYGVQKITKLQLSKKNAILVYIASVFVTISIHFLLKSYPLIPVDYWKQIMIYNSPLMICLALGLFCYFRTLKIDSSNISKIASSALAIYLIQDHSMMREALWLRVMKCDWFYESKFMVVHFLSSVILISVVGILMDKLRICLVKQIAGKYIKVRKDEC